jgi:hypothetical protein
MNIMLLRSNPTFALHSFLPSVITNDICVTLRGSATAITQCTILKFCTRSSEEMQFLEKIF